MGEFLSPGIFILERASQAQVIQGVSTSNMAIVGFTKRGLVNEPTLVTSYEQFTSLFGNVIAESLVPLEVAAFFSNEGARAFVVRVVGAGAAKAQGKFMGTSGAAVTALALGTGNGVQTVFTGSLSVPSGSRLKPGTVTVVAGGVTATDTDALNGTGTLSGSGIASGSINYTTGAVSVTFSAAPTFGTAVTANAQGYVLWGLQAAWEGEQGDGLKVRIKGNANFATTTRNTNAPGVSYSKYDIAILMREPFNDTTKAYEQVEVFEETVFTNATDTSFVQDVIDASSGFLDVIDETALGNPHQLNSKSVLNETVGTGDGSDTTYSGTLVQGGFVRNSLLIQYTGTSAASSANLMTGAGATAISGVQAPPGGFELAKQTVTLSWRAAGLVVPGAALGTGDGTTANFGLSIAGGFIRGSLTIDWNESTANASGSITTVAGSSLIDGETFTLNDGFHAPVVFEFDTNGSVTAGRVAVVVSALSSASQVRDAIMGAINGLGSSFFITATSGGASTVTLANDCMGATGNTSSSETVANVTFAVTNMTGGTSDAKSATDNGSGGLTGDATGSVNYLTGSILLQTGSFPPVGAFTADYAPPIAKTAVDNGAGAFTGNVAAPPSGSINYSTGAISVTVDAAVPTGEIVTVTYKSTTGTKTITDDGLGNLVGDVGVGTNVINADTGVFSFVTASAPNGTTTLKAFYGKAPELTVLEVTLSGGADGAAVTRSQVSDPTLAATNAGLFALDAVDEILNLIVPDFDGNATVAGDQIDYAEGRKDVFVILSPGASKSPQQAADYSRVGLNRNTSYAALYYPHITVADPLRDGRPKNVPPLGHIAGVFARTDINRNVGKAPAGINDGRLNFSIGLERNLSKGERDLIYPARVNPLIDTPATGRCVFGSRTLSLDSDFRQVSSRRLFAFVEKSVFNSTQFVLFEPIGPGLFSRIRLTLNGFLTNLFNFGYFSGNSPAEAFFVTVDESNNPPSQQEAGIVVIDVGLAPQNPNEFTVFRFQRKSLV